ncbi:malonyl-ACP O-methyltransferase BioC [Desulfuromonas carbonis]|uniref:malonyl-ACP O-methyltransferase BioC n=1 Tax=Desulfuromonas sp. DDH964 TaxID=1823759 RepID=UPI00078B27DA|nr:malonyl-ACP O-methyltransferase BioC [Desulfuromonas sp. DDH964]AMV72752.1 malonyl-CoA O-methyltransferase [Desulfuromonas sp. DDH964]
MTPLRPVDRASVKRNFARQASEYERHARVQRQVAQRLAGLLDGVDWPAGPILEVGCGTGLLSGLLSSRCAEASLILSDLAHPMTCCAANLLPAASAVDADAETLPFASGSCGLVASASVYQWLNSLPSALAEAGRILRPSGVLALALFGGRTLHELRTSHRRAVAESNSLQPSHALDFPDLGDLQAALAGSGLSPLQLFSDEVSETHRDVASLLRGLKGLGASNAARSRPPGLARRDVMQRMTQIYQAEFGRPGSIPATYEVIYLLARKVG